MNNFNLALKHFRKQHKLTQQQLSDKLHMERSTYASYETGKNEPSLDTVKALSKIYNITVDEMLNWEGC